jgi:hypothetical protein
MKKSIKKILFLIILACPVYVCTIFIPQDSKQLECESIKKLIQITKKEIKDLEYGYTNAPERVRSSLKEGKSFLNDDLENNQNPSWQRKQFEAKLQGLRNDINTLTALLEKSDEELMKDPIVVTDIEVIKSNLAAIDKKLLLSDEDLINQEKADAHYRLGVLEGQYAGLQCGEDKKDARK